MIRYLRNLNILLAVTIVYQMLLLANPNNASAATTPFMYNPYFGNTITPYSLFDHQYPDYGTNNIFTRHDGNSWTGNVGPSNCSTSTNCYDGHDGYDYPVQYKPILSVAAGTIMYAGWANSNHETDLGLMLRVDHTNNHRTRYGHMSAIMYSTNETVGARWQIGTSGTTGNSSGPHLHLTVLVNVNGSYQVKDPYGWSGSYGDPWQQYSGVTSEWLWVSNPTTPIPVDYEIIIIDDLNSGFTKWCNTSSCPYWNASNYGYNNHMWWTYSNGATATYWAKWQPNLPTAGTYEVQVYIPNNNATTHAARYLIQYNGGSRTVIVDQHDTYGDDGGRWVSLGQHYFNSGTSGYVRVSDSTYIPNNYTEGTNKKVGVDAVRWIKH